MARQLGLVFLNFLVFIASQSAASFFDASPTIPGIRCHYHPSTIIKYFPVDMTFAKATLHCKTFNAKIASNTSCVQDFLRPRGSFAWLASRHGNLQYASDEKLYDLTSDPAPKHKVVCELESESSYMCEKTRAHIAVYANTATWSQAKEQCRRLGGRLPAGGDDVDCLNHALTTMRGGSPAKGTKPWVEQYDEQPLNMASPSYTVHDSKKRMQKPIAQQVHTVACAFNLREYFCAQPDGAGGVAMVHYPYTSSDSKSKANAFCQEQPGEGRAVTTHEMQCISEFRDIINKETGHLENSLDKQVCVFAPRQQVQLSSPPGGTTPKSETLCGHWKVFEHTKTFEKLTYENAQAACRKNVGFFLPSEALWNNVLMEMKTGTGECRELAATFDKVPLWFTRHGKEERSYALYSSVCVGARLPGGAVSSRRIRRDEGVNYIEESGHVKCVEGYRTSLRESIPAKPYKGIWQNTAGCYKYVSKQGANVSRFREDGSQAGTSLCGMRKFVVNNINVTARCQDGYTWTCPDLSCSTWEDDHKMWPVCSEENLLSCTDKSLQPLEPSQHVKKETGTFRCTWPAVEHCADPPCAGGIYHNAAHATPFIDDHHRKYADLPQCRRLESLLTGDHHWYYSPLKTTIDRASMACEDMGTRLMTLDEVLEIRNSIPENNIARSFVWALNPVTNAPLAVKMRTEEHSTSMLSASILCKSSTKLEEKGSCWTNDTFSLFPEQFTNYWQAVGSCDAPLQDNSIIPFPFLHYCMDSLTRWTTTYHSYWMLKQTNNFLSSARTSDLHQPSGQRDDSNMQPRICWIKRPSPHLTTTVKHECQNYELHYIINKTISHYFEAEAQCRKEHMTLPSIETKECLSLFVKKLGIVPAWISGVAHNSHAKTSTGDLVHTSHLKSVICAKQRTWIDVKHECPNFYDLYYIKQESTGATYDEAHNLCRARNMRLPGIDRHFCLFRFFKKLSLRLAWISGKRISPHGLQSVDLTDSYYRDSPASVICVKHRPQVHRCGRYDLHYVSQEHAHSAMGAKKLCAKKQMAFPESQTDECLSLFIRILDIDVWTDVAGYANRMVICVIHHHCDNVPSIRNGKADEKSVRFAHNVTYSCKDGYLLVGNPTPSCQANGKLTSVPFCDAIHHCDNVPSIPNGKADKKSVRFAHNVTYSCSDGFSLVGNPTPSCQANGKLTSAPFCDANAKLTGHQYCSQVSAVLKRTHDYKYFNYPMAKAVCQGQGGKLLSRKAYSNGCTSGLLPVSHIAWIDTEYTTYGAQTTKRRGAVKSYGKSNINEYLYVVCEISP